MNKCGCKYGVDCTKTTVCAINGIVEELRSRITALEVALKPMANAHNSDSPYHHITMHDLRVAFELLSTSVKNGVKPLTTGGAHPTYSIESERLECPTCKEIAYAPTTILDQTATLGPIEYECSNCHTMGYI